MAKLKKLSRFEHFQSLINIVSSDHFIKITDTKLPKKMKESNFITQAKLGELLLNFKYYVRSENKTKSYLVNFRGQLERGEAKYPPHWQLYLNTSTIMSFN